MTHDFSGKDRLVTNVIASWAGYLVFFIAGLILPRLIHEQLGQTALGVWDLAWSLVAYFGLAQLGIGSSVNRYVSRYRMRGDNRGLARAVSTVWILQWVAALFAWTATLFVTLYALPVWFAAKLGDFLTEARWLVFWLGSALAIQIAFDAFSGVVTGSHRWDWHNALNAGGYAVGILGMAAVLWWGGGLASLAAVYCITVIATELARYRLARHLCPMLVLGPAHFCWRHAKAMALFGIKTLSGGLSELLSIQTVQLLVAFVLGPAALALFARPYALVRHIKTFVYKFSFVLAPTASALQSVGQREALAQLALDAMRYGVLLALPPCLGLAVLGEAVLAFWMGPEYVRATLMAILALGFLFSAAGAPAMQILIGMNRHGRATLLLLASSFLTVILAALALTRGGRNLEFVALAVIVPSVLVHGLYIPLDICRRLGIACRSYYREVWGRPLRALVPFVALLGAIRYAFPSRPGLQLFAALALGTVVLVASYWHAGFLPERLRTWLSRALAWPRQLAGALVKRTGL